MVVDSNIMCFVIIQCISDSSVFPLPPGSSSSPHPTLRPSLVLLDPLRHRSGSGWFASVRFHSFGSIGFGPGPILIWFHSLLFWFGFGLVRFDPGVSPASRSGDASAPPRVPATHGEPAQSDPGSSSGGAGSDPQHAGQSISQSVSHC